MADQAGWNTIESDAGVFTYLVEKLGVQDVQFEELVSLDEADLRALGPLYGVIFLFKFPTDTPYTTASGAALDGTLDHPAAQTLFFARQVIPNACATQALLALLLNQPGLSLGPTLTDFAAFTSAFDPALRGEALSNAEPIRAAHNTFSRATPFADESAHDAPAADAFHFIAYTAAAGTLYELDGLQAAPIAHGPTSPGTFAADVVPVLQRRIGRYPASEIRFNLLAMTRDRRALAREAGDAEGLAREEARRRDWAWENELRRANLVGAVGETMRAVARQRVDKGGEEEWVAEARAKSAARRGADE